ncbi:MAG: 2-hydroxyhepta-2,4-diene-1,7-dioate isomerase [Flavobacteriales bacterium]|nr:2-hydroxyhepta-2,4-diene-1,7-dioate isomerase [Flavobacteriales bacterium]|tara:strand:- start:13719 stop:14330 length:612 start_codon:yes stop_codon:yes gene_type:complete
MKIICIGRNYPAHISELKNIIPNDIIFFLKPETSIVHKKQPFFIPDFSNNIHHEIEVVIKINKSGKHINEKFSYNYYNELTVGIDFTARDIQQQLKQDGYPWEKAKAFDGSAVIGTFINKENIADLNNLYFKLLVNSKIKQSGNTKNMIFKIDNIISYVSKYITLKKGDLIFTGTPSGVDKVNKNDILEGYIEDKQVFKIRVK